MIYCGIKIGVNDYAEKIKSNASFFEILYENNYAPLEYSEMVTLIKVLKKPFFFHLSTSYIKNKDKYLLNIASTDKDVRKDSRSIIRKEIRGLSKYKPNGYIIHSPTELDFSRNRKIFGGNSRSNNYIESFRWVHGLSLHIYVENSPEAISIGNKNYYTKPINNIHADEYGLKCLLDTGHFYTNCLVNNKKFSNETSSSFLENFSYFHISALKKKAPYDTHGSVFLPVTQNFPSGKQLAKLLSKILVGKRVSNCYIVCEPSGNSWTHIDNFQKLAQLSITK